MEAGSALAPYQMRRRVAQVPIGEDDLPTPAFTSSAPRVNGADRRARVFQGGFYRDLHRMLGVASGTEASI